MIEYSSRQKIVSFLKPLLLIDGIAITLAALGWWFLMEHSIRAFAICIAIAGICVLMIAGVFLGGGAHYKSADFDGERVRATTTSVQEQFEHDQAYRNNSTHDALLMFIAGIVPLLGGGLIYWFVS